jgi:murein DD-endopeptidase MepM/ murein hydrolase activator NlpD
LPVSGWISDRFGPRGNRPVADVGVFHYGTDIAAACGRGVYAATGGTVVYADELGSHGLWILIDHGNRVQTGYADNRDLYVGVGQYVGAGRTSPRSAPAPPQDTSCTMKCEWTGRASTRNHS